MPANYSIKRNSLSSKWGVWTNGTDPASTVEKLVAELRSNEEAEAYCARIEAGEAHDVIIASFSAKKPRKEGGGILGRFRKKSSEQSEQAGANGSVNNPVIEIETVEVQETAGAEIEPEQPQTRAPEAPSRYQVIEQTRPVPQVVVEPAAPVQPEEVQHEQVGPEQAPVPEPVTAPMAETEAAPESVTVPEPAPAPEPKAETEPEPAPPASASHDAEAERIKMVANPASLSDKVKAAFGRGKAAPEPAIQDVSEPAQEQKASANRIGGQPRETSAETPEATAEVSEKAEISSAKAEPDVRDISETQAQKTAIPEQALEQETAIAEPAPRQKTDSPTPTSDQDDDLLVDWTFTPPPDITPEELKASGQTAPEAAAEAAAPVASEPIAKSKAPEPPAPKEQQVAKPEAAKAPVTAAEPAPAAKAQPAKAAPAKKPTAESPAAESARQELATAGKAAPAPAPVAIQPKKIDPELSKPSQSTPTRPETRIPATSKLTVDIGVSKALREVTTGDPRVSDKRYNSVASKEYTEVNKAFTTGNSPKTLHEELMHLAAVCLAWADAIEKRQAGKSNRKAA